MSEFLARRTTQYADLGELPDAIREAADPKSLLRLTGDDGRLTVAVASAHILAILSSPAVSS